MNYISHIFTQNNLFFEIVKSFDWRTPIFCKKTMRMEMLKKEPKNFFVCSLRFVGGLTLWMECEGASPGGQTHETTLIPPLLAWLRTNQDPFYSQIAQYHSSKFALAHSICSFWLGPKNEFLKISFLRPFRIKDLKKSKYIQNCSKTKQYLSGIRIIRGARRTAEIRGALNFYLFFIFN